MDTPQTSLPLGFWLRAADRILAQRVRDALAQEGATRREWRALNVIAGRMPRPARAARPCPRPHHGRRREMIDGLVARGWVARGEDGPTLTDDGAAALDRLTDVVGGVRERVAELVDVAQLQTSLEALVRGLGWEEDRPLEAAFERGYTRGFEAGRIA